MTLPPEYAAARNECLVADYTLRIARDDVRTANQRLNTARAQRTAAVEALARCLRGLGSDAVALVPWEHFTANQRVGSGSAIQDCAREAVAIAGILDDVFVFEFNGHLLMAVPGESADDVYRQWAAKMPDSGR